MLVGRRNAMNRWNEHFMAQLGSSIATFDASNVDMGGAPTNQAICDYIYSRNRRVLPQQVCAPAGMRAQLICNVSIETRLVNSTLIVIKTWSNDVIVVSPVGRKGIPHLPFPQNYSGVRPVRASQDNPFSYTCRIIMYCAQYARLFLRPRMGGHGGILCGGTRICLFITRSFTSRRIHLELPS